MAQTDPTRFVSGSDDGTVRLWSIRDDAPTAVIDAKANVCSVQFSPVSSHLLAFGSANYRMYLYDLRRMKVRPFFQSLIWLQRLLSLSIDHPLASFVQNPAGLLVMRFLVVRSSSLPCVCVSFGQPRVQLAVF